VRTLVYAALLVAASFLPAQAQGTSQGAAAEVENANWLFVQTADSLASDGKTITLNGASAQTIMFSDRPQRITGNASTQKFVEFWDKGKDSFQKDPPNATLTTIVDGKVQTAVVELTEPKLSGTSLTYTVKVLDGEVPKAGQNPSLFIDWWRGGWGWGPGPRWGVGCRVGPYGGVHCW